MLIVTEIFPNTRHCEMIEQLSCFATIIKTFSWRLSNIEASTIDVVHDIVSLSSQACLDEFEVLPVTFQVLNLYIYVKPLLV